LIAATSPYFSAVSKIAQVGKEIADFMKAGKINPNTTHCIGHSLGKYIFFNIFHQSCLKYSFIFRCPPVWTSWKIDCWLKIKSHQWFGINLSLIFFKNFQILFSGLDPAKPTFINSLSKLATSDAK
jgi:hypothetical protein